MDNLDKPVLVCLGMLISCRVTRAASLLGTSTEQMNVMFTFQGLLTGLNRHQLIFIYEMYWFS